MITDSHRQEWLDSGVSPEIIALNVRSLDGTMGEDAPIELLTQNVERNKTRAFNGLPKNIGDRYRHTHAGGWWCSGVDVLTGLPSQWGCFKPDHPYTYTEYKQGFDPENRVKKQKTIKYEHPKKTETEIFALRITDDIWQKIAGRCGVAPYCLIPETHPLHTPPIDSYSLVKEGCDPHGYFWQWVIDNRDIPIIITEGAKKAGALLTAGYVAIALPGIWNGRRQPKDELGNKSGLPYLIPQLKPFATKGREINFCFDKDSKLKTKLNVRQAIEATGKLFGFSGCQVKVIEWDAPEKGVDDLIVSRGQEYFEAVFNSRLTLAEYKLKNCLDLTPYIDLTINERYIPDSLVFPENTKLIGLRSPQGTGKTHYLAKKIQPYLDKGQRVLVIVHREQLARELARRFGIDYRTEIKESDTKGVLGYSLCIDSLHEKANPKFNPSEWEDSIIIIDEIEQVLWHLLEGGTTKSKRTLILKAFRELLQTVACSEQGKIFIADADLSPISINYIEQLIGFKIPRFIVDNSYVPNTNRTLYKFSGICASELISRLNTNLTNGEKAIIHTDGQKHKANWGTRNLESWVQRNFPDKKVLRIDRKSVGDKNHPAYGCIDSLNQVVKDYDVVICSPVIETGVSIDVDHFDGVYVISHGVQTVNGVVQETERVRSNCPRYVWSKQWSFNRIGNGSNDIKNLLKSTHKVASANISLLQKMGIYEGSELSFYEQNDETKYCSPSLIAWAKYAAIENNNNYNFADNLFKKYERLGYEVLDDSEDEGSCVDITDEIKIIKEDNYQIHCLKVMNSPTITHTEYEQLKEKRGLTESENDTLKKAEIQRLYATDDVDPELIEKHDDRWFPKIQLHYYLTVGNSYLPKREKKALEKLKESGDGVFKPDINKSFLGMKIFALQILKIEQFFDPDAEFSSESLKRWFEKITTPVMKFQIKSIFGFGIGARDSAVSVAQRFLEKLGLKMPFDRQETVNGKRVRVYRGCDVDSDSRSEIFKRWLERDSQSEDQAQMAVA